MKKIFVAILLVIGAFSLISCNKDQVQNNEASTKDKCDYVYKMSLEEFANSVETDEEIKFFKSHQIIDYSNICEDASQYIASGNDINRRRIKIKFRWFVGCEKAFGICIVIPIGINDANASLLFYKGKCIIIPDSDDDNGLTSDGFLPVYCDIPIDDSIKIKEGIYASYYDKKTKQRLIAVDLVK